MILDRFSNKILISEVIVRRVVDAALISMKLFRKIKIILKDRIIIFEFKLIIFNHM